MHRRCYPTRRLVYVAMSAKRKRRAVQKRRRPAGGIHHAMPRATPLREADSVVRLAYSRRQAAEALGVSISTVDRRVVPAIQTVKAPWGQRLIPVSELERFVQDHRETRKRAARRPAGRPTTLPSTTVQRIRREFDAGRSLGEVARALNADGVPTAHGGRQWWPSTVRSILHRDSR